MTDREFLLAVLADGRPRSQAEILRRSFDERGCGLTIHSRAADLRRHGYDIRCEPVKGKVRGEAWLYTLVAAPGGQGESDVEPAGLPCPAPLVEREAAGLSLTGDASRSASGGHLSGVPASAGIAQAAAQLTLMDAA